MSDAMQEFDLPDRALKIARAEPLTSGLVTQK